MVLLLYERKHIGRLSILYWSTFKFWSSERNSENTMSDLYFDEERDCYYDENTMTIKSFVPPFFNHFSLNLNQKKRVVMRAMRKKLNIFALQLPREAFVIQLLLASDRLLDTRVSLIYLVYAFFFCSWCSWTKWGGWVHLSFYLLVSGVPQKRGESKRIWELSLRTKASEVA